MLIADWKLEQTLHAVRSSLKVYQSALNDGIEAYLQSKVIKPVFRKYN
jgi:glutamate-1-semialdehyde 2,1-aminomutase